MPENKIFHVFQENVYVRLNPTVDRPIDYIGQAHAAAFFEIIFRNIFSKISYHPSTIKNLSNLHPCSMHPCRGAHYCRDQCASTSAHDATVSFLSERWSADSFLISMAGCSQSFSLRCGYFMSYTTTVLDDTPTVLEISVCRRLGSLSLVIDVAVKARDPCIATGNEDRHIASTWM